MCSKINAQLSNIGKSLSKHDLQVSLSVFRNDLKNDTRNFFEKQILEPSSTDMQLLRIMKRYYRKDKGWTKKDYLSQEFEDLVIPFDILCEKFNYSRYITDYLNNSGYIVNMQGEGLILMPKGYDAVHDIRIKRLTIIGINVFVLVGVICTILQTIIIFIR